LTGQVRFGIIGTSVGAGFCARGFSMMPKDGNAKLVAVTSRREERAIIRAKEFQPYKPRKPIELKVEFHNSERAEAVSKRSGVVRIDGRTVSYTGNNMVEVYCVLL